MPYSRRRYASKRRAPRRAPRRRAPARKKAFKRFANRVLRTANEKKFVTTSTIGSTPVEFSSTSPWTVALTPVATGDSYQTRDGNQIYLRSIEARVAVRFNPVYPGTSTAGAEPVLWDVTIPANNPTVGYTYVRCVVWQYLPQSDSAAILPLSTVIQTFNGVYSTLAPYNHDTRKDFRVLYDRMRLVSDVLGPQGTGAGANTAGYTGVGPSGEARFTFRIRKFANRAITWSGNSTVANNHVYLSLFPDYDTSTGENSDQPCLAAYMIKTNFSDK